VIGGWRLPQKSSYFVLRLSGWLVYALDMTEEPDMPDLDEAQFEFFERHAQQNASERVLLITHVPDYTKTSHLGMKAPPKLAKLKELLGERLALHLSGDVHHYRRYEAEEKTSRMLVISGAGGAFSHATSVPHAPQVTDGGCEFNSVASYPTPAACDEVFASRVLTMVHRGAVTYLGIFYAGMVAASASVGPWLIAAGTPAAASPWEVACEFWNQSATGSCYTLHGSVLVLLVIHIIFHITSESGGLKFWFRALSLAGMHTLAHVAACFALRTGLELLLQTIALDQAGSVQNLLAYRTTMLVAMYFLGGWLGLAIYNAYFYMAFLFFRLHWNEAYCSIADEGHKNFLRMRVTPAGDLDVYAIGLETVPRQWIAGKQQLKPAEPLVPHLIEHFSIPAN